jgi:thioredoxin 1
MIKLKRFTASWCQPCKQLAPIIEQLKPEYPEVIFQTIDVDEDPEIAKNYAIKSVPTIVIEQYDEIKQQIVGLQPKQTYINILNSLI